MNTGHFLSHLQWQSSGGSGLFGSVHCPGCELYWGLDFVPEYCPRCGAKVTNNPAQSHENLFQLLRDAGSSFSQCTYCKKGVPGEPKKWANICPYCSGELKLIQKATRSFKRIINNSAR